MTLTLFSQFIFSLIDQTNGVCRELSCQAFWVKLVRKPKSPGLI